MFGSVFMNLDEGIPREGRQTMEAAFESFCLSVPWGALFHATSPYPPWSAAHMARRLAALLRFWDVFQGPRYAFWVEGTFSLEELVAHHYGITLEAWCPGGAASVRAHLESMVERMARATREECTEAVLRVVSSLVRTRPKLHHLEVLGDPDFARARLAALPPKEFESLSSAYRYAVNGELHAWDRALGRH